MTDRAPTLLSTISRLRAEELLRLTAPLERAATPDDVIPAVHGDPEHKLHPAFSNLTSHQAWTARLAWLINRMRLEQGLPMSLLSETPDIIADLCDHRHLC